MKTQICIIGGGPSGLLLAQLLNNNAIDTVVIERRNKEHVLSRIRAGVLEQGFSKMMRDAGCGERMDKEGEVHSGFQIADGNRLKRIDLSKLTGGRTVMVYGQTELTRDLYDARERANGLTIYNVEDVNLNDLTTDAPVVEFSVNGETEQIYCDLVVGADGFHGVSRKSIPKGKLTEHGRTYPFGWLGILSRTKPVSSELVYARHSRGFALCSMRNKLLSRYYIQVPISDSVEDWSDDRFWNELRSRLPDSLLSSLETGSSIEKSIAPLRSYVAEPMSYGNLFLAGDAAHIVPPTGAKGLNSAGADIYYLYHAILDRYLRDDKTGLDNYSSKALTRVWKTQRFSWWMTSLLHVFPEATSFEKRLQESELNYLLSSENALSLLAENYVGLPY